MSTSDAFKYVKGMMSLNGLINYRAVVFSDDTRKTGTLNKYMSLLQVESEHGDFGRPMDLNSRIDTLGHTMSYGDIWQQVVKSKKNDNEVVKEIVVRKRNSVLKTIDFRKLKM